MNTDRRSLLIGLTGAALVVASGCAALRSESELESALEELDLLLDSIGGDDDRLVVLAGRIREQSRALADAHHKFEIEFNRLATDRDVPDAELSRLVSQYDSIRLEHRNQLLRSQDELRRAVPADTWPDVLEVLNRKQRGRVPGRAQEA